MPHPTQAPLANKSAYSRPYKTRAQRRDDARRQHDETGDQRFLVRVSIAIGLLILVAIGFAVTGMADQKGVPVRSARSSRAK